MRTEVSIDLIRRTNVTQGREQMLLSVYGTDSPVGSEIVLHDSVLESGVEGIMRFVLDECSMDTWQMLDSALVKDAPIQLMGEYIDNKIVEKIMGEMDE